MINRLILACFTLIAFLFSSCGNENSQRHNEFQNWINSNGKVRVLSTTGMINDLVKQIGGDEVLTLTLIQGDLDPHSYQLVKGDDEKLAMADIIFFNGLGLEHGSSMQYQLANNPKAVGVGNLIDSKAVIYVGNQKDPHIWMDISLWAQTIPFITKALSEKDPAHAELYKKNAERLNHAMIKAHERLKEYMHLIPEEERYLVTSHDAFNYFARAYLSRDSELEGNRWQKRFMAPEGLAPEGQLSTTDIKLIIDHVKAYKIRMLFSESNVSRDSIIKIIQAGKEEGLNVKIACCPLYGDAMGSPGSEGDTYLKMMDYNAKMIASHLWREDNNNSSEKKD